MRWLVVFAVACSGSKAPPPPTPSGPAASLTATAAHDDVQVATVNGRPVRGSCVTEQAARGATRDDALKQCIDFELMAQVAEARPEATRGIRRIGESSPAIRGPGQTAPAELDCRVDPRDPCVAEPGLP